MSEINTLVKNFHQIITVKMVALVDFFFVNMALATSVVGLLINYLEDKLPSFVTRTFRYGKFSAEDSKSKSKKGFDWIRSSQVPKSYFKHFYVVATILSLVAFFTAVRVYIFGIAIPNWLFVFLDFWCGQNRKATGDFNVLKSFYPFSHLKYVFSPFFIS